MLPKKGTGPELDPKSAPACKIPYVFSNPGNDELEKFEKSLKTSLLAAAGKLGVKK